MSMEPGIIFLLFMSVTCGGFSASSGNMSYITLGGKQLMPAVGYGTWQAQGEDFEKCVDLALESGYRHIDTATVYENEHIIGKVLDKWLKSGKVKREELFIVTKVPPSGNRPSSIEQSLKESLEKLRLDYVDLYLVHTPFSFVKDAGLHPVDENGFFKFEPKTDHIGVWKEMEKQVDAGRAKAIGLSNFNSSQIAKVLKEARIPPVNLQVEMHAYFQQAELMAYCKANNIKITAYAPLGSKGSEKLLNITIPNLLENPVAVKLAEKYNKKPAQILLKFLVQKGVAVIPKSTNAGRMKQNIEIFDFQISEEDYAQLEGLDQGPKGRILDFSFMKGIKNNADYPF